MASMMSMMMAMKGMKGCGKGKKGKSSSASSKPVSSDEVEQFLTDSGIIGDPASDDFRGCPPDVQRIVMDRGGFEGTSNPAASLIGRIKKAREQCGSVFEGKGKGGGTSSRGASLDPPTSEELEMFLMEAGIFDSAGDDFRGCPPDVQKIVMDRGSLVGTQNPSASLIGRIKKARAECGSVYEGGASKVAGPGKFSGGDGGGMAAKGGGKAAMKGMMAQQMFASMFGDPVEWFIQENGVEGDYSADDLRGCPPDVQQLVMSEGTLAGAHRPGGALIGRIKRARIQCGSSYQGPGKSAPSWGSMMASMMTPSMMDPVELFIAGTGIDGDSAANDLRGCPPDVQQMVMEQGSLDGTSNPAAALIGRIKRARQACGSSFGGPSTGSYGGGGKSKGKGGKKAAADITPEDVETFISENGIDGDPIADDLRGCPLDVQQLVVEKGSLAGTRNPAASLLGRIKQARTACGSKFDGVHIHGRE